MEANMKATGFEIKHILMEGLFIVLENIILANLNMIKLMELVLFFLVMDLNMLENGRMIRKMALD